MYTPGSSLYSPSLRTPGSRSPQIPRSPSLQSAMPLHTSSLGRLLISMKSPKLGDSYNDFVQQVNSSKLEAQTAKQEKDLASIEVEELKRQLEAARKEVAEVTRRAEHAEGKYEELQNALSNDPSVEVALQKMTDRVVKAQDETTAHKAKITELRTRIEEVRREDRTEELLAKVRALEEELEQRPSEDEVHTMQSQINDLTIELSGRPELSELTDVQRELDMQTREADAAHTALREAQARITARAGETENLAAKCTAFAKENKDLTRAVDSLTKENESLKSHCAVLEKRVEELAKTLDTVEYNSGRDIRELKAMIKDADADHARTVADLNAAVEAEQKATTVQITALLDSFYDALELSSEPMAQDIIRTLNMLVRTGTRPCAG
ncbi:hypothetical protein J8273_2038 [Carpediemonas membranifera]|uniref:Uncharacterized protein n=1 Tax=Carpediemonas membranifera TaxID=201153 RepID=A0A8J6E5U4_9EUKA|nr:hypothetical protein J8273_2038 [Carpediemonas membranifera]|eukprot:KAG9396307.1 hypothetical protein J8273_2038 [Carpediemonas membranifera]